MSRARRGFLTIASGTAIGQIAALLCAPLLSRLYSPADFGMFSVLSALTVTLGSVAALRLELAIPLPARDQDAHALVGAGFALAIVMNLLAVAAVAIFGGELSDAFEQPLLKPWLWAVPICAQLMSTYLLLNQVAIRRSHYGAIGRRNVLQALAMLATQIGAGLAGLKPGGLFLGLGIGNLVGVFSLSLSLKSQDLWPGSDRLLRMRQVVSRYRRFILVLAPSGLLNVLGLQLPVLLVAFWYSGETAGWLGLTQRVLGLPVTLVGTAIAQVYLSELAKAAREDSARAMSLFIRVSVGLLVCGAILALALVLAGPWLFVLAFGEQWAESGHYARALGAGLAAQLVASPLSQTLIVLERTGLQFAWDALRVAVTVAAVGSAVWSGASAESAIWILSATMVLLYGMSWLMSLASLRRLGQRP